MSVRRGSTRRVTPCTQLRQGSAAGCCKPVTQSKATRQCSRRNLSPRCLAFAARRSPRWPVIYKRLAQSAIRVASSKSSTSKRSKPYRANAMRHCGSTRHRGAVCAACVHRPAVAAGRGLYSAVSEASRWTTGGHQAVPRLSSHAVHRSLSAGHVAPECRTAEID